MCYLNFAMTIKYINKEHFNNINKEVQDETFEQK